jgi:hypothetical protein
MALSSEAKKASEKTAGNASPLPAGLVAAGLERANVANSPCVGVDTDEQGGIEIEDSEGQMWVFPYSVFLFALVRRETLLNPKAGGVAEPGRAADIMTVTIGGYVATIHGRGLRIAAEGMRRYRVAYLRPIGHDLAETAPDKQAIIEKITIAKEKIQRRDSEDTKDGNEPHDENAIEPLDHP